MGVAISPKSGTSIGSPFEVMRQEVGLPLHPSRSAQ